MTFLSLLLKSYQQRIPGMLLPLFLRLFSREMILDACLRTTLRACGYLCLSTSILFTPCKSTTETFINHSTLLFPITQGKKREIFFFIYIFFVPWKLRKKETKIREYYSFPFVKTHKQDKWRATNFLFFSFFLSNFKFSILSKGLSIMVKLISCAHAYSLSEFMQTSQEEKWLKLGFY